MQIGTETLVADGSRNWNGMLDDVALFNYALGEAGIEDVMQGNFPIGLQWDGADSFWGLLSDPGGQSHWLRRGMASDAIPGATIGASVPAGICRVIAAQEVKELLVEETGTVDVTATGQLTVTDNVTVAAGATLKVDGTLTASSIDSATGSTLGGSGTVDAEVVAGGPTDHVHNHAESTLASGRRVTNGREYEISCRAGWIAGSNQLNSRLYFNRLARTTPIARRKVTAHREHRIRPSPATWARQTSGRPMGISSISRPFRSRTSRSRCRSWPPIRRGSRQGHFGTRSRLGPLWVWRCRCKNPRRVVAREDKPRPPVAALCG